MNRRGIARFSEKTSTSRFAGPGRDAQSRPFHARSAAVSCPIRRFSINHRRGHFRPRAEVLAVFSPERRLLSREAYKSWFFAFISRLSGRQAACLRRAALAAGATGSHALAFDRGANRTYHPGGLSAIASDSRRPAVLARQAAVSPAERHGQPSRRVAMPTKIGLSIRSRQSRLRRSWWAVPTLRNFMAEC